MNADSRFWFLTFADSRMRSTLTRIGRQAKALNLFGDRICTWTESDLDVEFLRRMEARLVPGSRGYGYWCWKPQIMLQLLRKISDGDVVLYVDAGCHINPRGIKRLREYFDLATEHGIVGFQSRALGEESRRDLRCHFLIEHDWSKMALLKWFGVERNGEVLDSAQYGGTVMLACRRPKTMDFFERFLSVFENHFELCDDSPSEEPERATFRENRHDQSVFSILAKLNGVYALSSAEYVPVREFMPKGGNPALWPERWSDLEQYPIWAKRDLGKFTRKVECPDWLKPVLGRVGRKFASRIYEAWRR